MGLILPQTIKINVGSRTKYYREKGYDVKYCDIIDVNVLDLPKHSKARVNVECDECREKYDIQYLNYNKYGTNKLYCYNCRNKKIKNNSLIKHGVVHHLCLDEVKNKRFETNLKKYGSACPIANNDINKKKQQTMMDKYGVPHAKQSKEFREKDKNTCLNRYGTEYTFQVEKFKEKSKKTINEKYGCDNVMQNKDILKRCHESLHKNGTGKCSKQQKYLHNLFGGELNYPIDRLLTDICFVDKKICLEYDGSGHNLNVIYKNLTKEEFDAKERKRYYVLKKFGYKIITFISEHDKLPSDEILLDIKDKCVFFLENFDDNWITVDLETGKIKTKK